MQAYSFGPVLTSAGARFRLWAPKQESVSLVIDGAQPLPMQAMEDGWHSLHVDGVKAGARYGFLLEDGLFVPDPASRFQPDDVHEASELIDDGAFQWAAQDWKGRPWSESVIYEAHIGTFTEEGTFLSAIERLDALAELGVTVLQLMPVADFPGRRGWGYDGVLPYAPEASYGRPDDLKALVDAAHMRGISVMLDVVYNHLGPDGNYLPNYAPFFTERHKTPWGDGPNFDGDAADSVRTFVVENALYWLDVFRIDGLRLDAIHAILDDSEHHILHEIAEQVRSAIGERHVHLVVENEDNDADLLERDGSGQARHYTAQWCDDIHHVLHAAATGERDGYYADYAGDPQKFARALAEGFVYQGEVMPHKGQSRGKPSAHLPPTAFISFIQNHDQIGNRLFGDRLSETLKGDKLKALAAIYLLGPQIPMLFMGEEWAASTPFPYFCDFHDALNAAVREGRKEEFGHDPSQAGPVEDAPDPTTGETFRSAKLRWEERDQGHHAEMLWHYRHLLALRRQHVQPLLDEIGSDRAHFDVRGCVVCVHWFAGRRRLTLVVNIGSDDAPAPPQSGVCFYPSPAGPPLTIAPWSVYWFTD